ncbi:hypothetical protein DPMN_156687 [Dreissena polymorpha]|uniref:Uncharacterized protein n=1 Tax=Dreissena polymorpha TaxID=45954 RepID=A0A9D4FPE8_DREPO|nr:hypothetical protein DPMN_156687 [Dreissena polymorpha]
MRSGFNSSGCMVCRLSVPYNENESHVPFLECGDHIEILMKNQLTYHHAIVEEFEYLGDGKGKIKVIDAKQIVPLKWKKKNALHPGLIQKIILQMNLLRGIQRLQTALKQERVQMK